MAIQSSTSGDRNPSCESGPEATNARLYPSKSHVSGSGFLRSGRSVAVFAALLVAFLVFLTPAPAQESSSCTGRQVRPTDDLDKIVNSDPQGTPTTFCLTTGTHVLSSPLTLYAGDALVGPVGETVRKGPSRYGLPTAKITDGQANLPRLITLAAGAKRLAWLELYGADGAYTSETKLECANWGEVGNRCPKAGTGVAVGSGQAGSGVTMRYLYIHDNDASGISSAKGRITNSHFTENTRNRDWLGFEGAAIKGVDEFEAARNYIHGEQGNGIWCDGGCDHVSAMRKGFWAHDNVVVDNSRWGIRYENSPGSAGSPVSALIEDNRLHGNGRESDHTGGGISMHDAQNGLFRANRFGSARVGGTSYQGNVDGLAVQFADTNRADRTNLRNGDAVYNALGGETVTGCSKPDYVVRCANNTRR